MAPRPPETGPAPKRIGRPPRIDKDAIARAVLEIGFDEVTMKRAAEHLGVSVPGLYHYVRGRDDLIRLAADHAMSGVALPVYKGQTWEDWLREWGRYIDRSMSLRPEVLQHFLTASIDDTRVIEVMGGALDRLVELGLTPEFAFEAWQMVAAVATGAAAGRVRERSAAESGQPWIARVHSILARMEPSELPALRAIASSRLPNAAQNLDRQLDTVIAGLQARRSTTRTD